jgi:hypothetical protein
MTHVPTNTDSLMLITLLITVAATVFWRTVIKLVAVSVILLAVLGFSELLRNVH